jgi:hypothetical protein
LLAKVQTFDSPDMTGSSAADAFEQGPLSTRLDDIEFTQRLGTRVARVRKRCNVNRTILAEGD